MKNFKITAFADEIDLRMDFQLKVLQKNKISHIEVRGLDGKNISEISLSEAKAYQQKFEAHQIKVSSLGSPIGKIDIEAPFEAHLELFKHVLKLAKIFKSPYIRMFSFYISEGKNPDDFRDVVIKRWQAFLEAAKDYPEITLLHENEKDIFGDTPERCLDLCQALKNPQLKLAFDPANFVQCDVEVFPKAFEMLKNEIAYVHIKDALFSNHEVMPAGYGDGQVKKVLEALVARDYHGFLSLEPHLANFTGFQELENGEESDKPEASEGEKLFNVASSALRKILDEMNQEWI
ncbi:MULTISPECIES: TIM barrel protein [unclassified Enterococcus]|uniref:sugar phosphate isomerase/epimerase family protein n=1 Tax=unclassified Enterococcus TaxID=2608891 RepID=UPI001554B7E8|nr:MULTISPECIES: TIM barrel protein [unclassified Enterococcus]MBS7578155.1 sugar phosphate isomerase/epimerase [Enterococcus sp. MMGLQ5-2]MBS7584029.1 sugar phosphate isomerase/epimerase [Enterococcus sp. MMGLQ5-1]NPD11890.1 sugar phosphate isomerase/epimerase [Enterococcus sp. MMGLQ5-1]NPD37986.1 sugar phosphate isomerase/epimerase [Enterococcus sp. MMGLQ5-2]